jgi:hypothetical protein
MSAGPTGVQGFQGIQGSQGATGATGLQGNAGAQGGQGVIGPPGATGPAGSAPSFSYYTISSFNQSIIANAVSILNTSVTYISQTPLPSAVKGRSGTLSVFLNLSTAAGFAANQYFDYGLYIDGTAIGIGDTTTMRYIQTAQNTCALSWNGYPLGTNGNMPYSPLTVPVSIGAGVTNLQIGIKNSSAALNVVASYAPSATVSTTIGTSFGSNYYTVPATAGGLAVVGVYAYCWGCSGSTYIGNSGSGGFTSGYYSCSPGVNLLYVVGTNSIGSGNANYGGAGPGNGAGGGAFSGLFLSNAGGIAQSNALLIAGGAGQSGGPQAGGGGGGGGSYTTNGTGIGYSGAAGYIYSSGPTSITGGTLAAGGSGTYSGTALIGGGNSGGAAAGGGGYYGGGGQSGFNTNQAGAGGSSYAANSITGPTFSPGITAQVLASNSIPPGGYTNPYYVTNASYNYGYGGCNINGGINSYGLVVLVPAVGTAPVYIGTQAAMVC